MLLRQVARGGVYSLVFSPDAGTLYTGDGSGTVTAWNWRSAERKLFQLQGRYASDIWRLNVTKDGQWFLAATPNSFRVWDATTQEFWPPVPVLATNFNFALASDDRTLAAMRDQSSIDFWDLQIRGPHPTRPAIRMPSLVVDVLFSPADTALAVVDLDGGLYLVADQDEQPIRINNNTDQSIAYSDGYRYLAFSADGKTLAVASSNSIQIWDIATRQQRRTIKAGRANVRQLAFHPDNQILASGGDTPVVTLWDVASGKVRQRYDWSIGSKIVSLAFAPDGMTAAAGGSNRKFVLWDLEE
jgi:WD40 repeat protein